MFQLQSPEEAFWEAFWEEFYESGGSTDDWEDFSHFEDSAPHRPAVFAIAVIAYALLWTVFWILPWQRVIWRAGYRGAARRILRVLISSPAATLIVAGLTQADFWIAAFYLLPLIGMMWISFAPWPAWLQKAEPEKPQAPKKLPPVTKFGQIDMLAPKVWVVRCSDGAYWIREEELARLELPLAVRLGKPISFIPIPNVKIPPKYEGKIVGVVRNGLSHVAAVA